MVGLLLNADREIDGGTTGGEFKFEEDGDIENDDYAQSSIYAILYAMYKNAGDLTSPHGVKYQFTFNTWGIAPSPYPVEDPERHGKAAYAGLVTQPPAKEYVKKLGKTPVEVRVSHLPFCRLKQTRSQHDINTIHKRNKLFALNTQLAIINEL